ncbi:6-hydroxynicotinate 3-monooxygenase-like [Hordeum vulgare]|uniref:FAD-binding domain-containing protein n=1 Tax=Hordeum vulgare subsp. vulgare TaxID=112509 RepID=A0A8I7B346_HORVV|nr:monooxygenase 2-like [Hordeum vulgare subsp. vulgare]KAE8779351.1 6-hydroxynicotinate 3-monooxygenase-like [Hordeum vulgare]
MADRGGKAPVSTPTAAADVDIDAEVVIVGAGIAGLATALALRRIGVGAAGGGVLVLERHAELRSTGAALTIFPNGWFALRALGVAHKLTSRYDAFETSRVTTLETGATQVFCFAGRKSSGDVRVRPMHRKALLEALAEELPPGTIRFSSKLASIDTEKAQGSPEVAVLRLDDGTVIRSKVVIGCDGVHSVVSQWLGLSEPASSGRSAVRGLAVYPDGHGLKRELRQFLSEGLRAGMVPISDTDVYWFLVNNTVSAEQEAGTDPAKILREVTDNLGRSMPAEYLDVARHSDPGNLSWAPLLYRAPWAILRGPAARGPVTVAGDAFHPMTPDMAQGGCSALEDAVVLARALSRAATPADGLAAYVAERRGRAAWLVAGAYLSGWVQQGGTNVRGVRGYMVRLFRDWIFYRFLFPRLADTMWFDCGDLVEEPKVEGRGKTHSE